MKQCPSCGLKYPNDNTTCFVDKTPLEALPDPYIGTLLKGRYMIERPLGEGGMAVVYRARNTLVERPVAIKIMNAHLASDASLKERFRREAKNAERVAHPNIIDIHDHGETADGTPFLVMEILEGEPLDKIIARGAMGLAWAASIALQVARGLARAHDFEVLHRDLKPENIFICVPSDGGDATAKILDFGIARSMHDSRLTNAGEIFGTPQYMAPERVTSTDAGASADLYALGVILFEMVTGELPFKSNDLPGFFIKHMHEPPPRPTDLAPTLPEPIERLILQLLEKAPEDRPVDAHAVVKALEPYALESAAPTPLVPRMDSEQLPAAAPTLPPTTLERWSGRAQLFGEMLRRAFPGAEAPPELVQGLVQIQACLARIEELRSNGLTYQRQLEQMESGVLEGRERLGFAVHTLAEDLSRARESYRAVMREAGPIIAAAETAAETYRAAHQKWLFVGGGGGPLPEPTTPAVDAARSVADALEEWSLACVVAEDARVGVAERERVVTDIEFQVTALRKQLDRVEADYEARRSSTEESLRCGGEEISSLEEQLTRLGADFVEPLQAHPALGELFAQLRREGTPAEGIAPLSYSRR